MSGCGRTEPAAAARVTLLGGSAPGGRRRRTSLGAGRGGAVGGYSGPPVRAEPLAVAFVSGSGRTKPSPACFRSEFPFQTRSHPLRPGPRRPEERLGRLKADVAPARAACGSGAVPEPGRSSSPPSPPRGSCARARAAQRGGGAVPCVAGPRREGRGRVPARLRRGNPAEQEAGCWKVRPHYSAPGGRRHEDGVDRTLPKGQAALAHRICDVSKPPLCASASRSV